MDVRVWNLLWQLGPEETGDLRWQVLAQEGPGALRFAHELPEEGVVRVDDLIHGFLTGAGRPSPALMTGPKFFGKRARSVGRASRQIAEAFELGEVA